MLKNIVIALVAVNVFYFIWMLIIGGSGYRAPSKEIEGVPSIGLLSSSDKGVYQSGTSANPSSCYAFGPLSTNQVANIIANKINGFGLWTDIYSRKTMQTLNFLVYLQPFASRQEAIDVIKEISKHEIKEYKLIESGIYKNAIALGSFTNLDQARRHSEYVRFLGFDARYTTQKKKKEMYWINFDEPFGTNVPVMEWARELDDKSTAQKIPKACANIGSQ